LSLIIRGDVRAVADPVPPIPYGDRHLFLRPNLAFHDFLVGQLLGSREK